MNNLDKVMELVARGALFLVNHSAGKDSQAMMVELAQIIPPEQMVVVHAELPGVDWPGLREHIEATVGPVPVYYCRAQKTFLGMVRKRGADLRAQGSDASPWPSPKYRQCTSDLKRGPLTKLSLKLAKERGKLLLVECMGFRAEESTARAKRPTLQRNKRMSKAGREVWTWLPIHEMKLAEVFETIERAGQKAHPAYAQGMTRLSCCFCIMASKQDLKTAARLMPELRAEYSAVEQETGKTMLMSGQTLAEVTA